MEQPTLKPRSAGDTIIEVMICLALLGLAFAISYATANHAVIQARNAEEHSQALGLLDSQVEELRAAYVDQTTPAPPTSGSYFCMNGAAPVVFSTAPPLNPSDETTFSEYPADCNNINVFYNQNITYNTASQYFIFTIRWQGLSTLGVQQEQLTYRITNLSTPTASAPWEDPGIAPPPPPILWSWKTNGDNGIVNGATCSSFGGDSGDPAPTNENYCDPAGGYNVGAKDCAQADPQLSQSFNTENVSPSMFARRDIIATYAVDNPTTMTGNIGVHPQYLPAGPADLTINYNQYAGAATGTSSTPPPFIYGNGNTPPPAGFTASGSPNYEYLVNIYFNSTSGTSYTGLELPIAMGAASWDATQESFPNTNFPTQITIPPNTSSVLIAWTNNEADQDNNGICTPNANKYDPDFQLNSITLNGQD